MLSLDKAGNYGKDSVAFHRLKLMHFRLAGRFHDNVRNRMVVFPLTETSFFTEDRFKSEACKRLNEV